MFKTLTEILKYTVNKRVCFGLLYDEDITPDLVTKSHFVFCLHSEMSLKLTKTFWRFHLHLPNIVSSRQDLIGNFYCFRFQVISTCLNEVKICGPSCLSVVSDCPLLNKLLAGENLKLVSKTFFNKATFITNFFFLVIFYDVFRPRIVKEIICIII